MATTKKQRNMMNIVMVVLAAIIVIAGVILVISIRGGSGSAQESPFSVSDKTGYANIQRSGISYALDKGTALQDGDAIETLNGSEVAVAVEGGSQVYLADASQLSVHIGGAQKASDARANSLELTSGSLFADVRDSGNRFNVEGSSTSWTAQDAVYVLSVQSGTVTMQVLAGSVESSDGTSVQAGQSYSMVPNRDKGDSTSVTTLSLSSLDSFALSHAEDAIAAGRPLSFTTKQIDDLKQSRIDEQKQAAQAATGSITVATGAEAQGASASSASASSASAETTESPASEEANTSQTTTDNTSTEAPSAAQDEEPQNDATEQLPSCTLQIRCDTILDNMDSLAEGKDKYVPKDGIILQTTKVTFSEGESAFDILKGACDQLGIALEYSYAPLYGSYYIEGIGNLYQFDCGDESGWMYKVNGWFPNYGCSEYKLSDGDAIVFCYTCKGIGADVE